MARRKLVQPNTDQHITMEITCNGEEFIKMMTTPKNIITVDSIEAPHISVFYKGKKVGNVTSLTLASANMKFVEDDDLCWNDILNS